MKRLFMLFILLSLFCFLQADLIDKYKMGEVTIVPDPAFGKDKGLELLNFSVRKYFAFAPDGRIFASDSYEHKIYILDKKGNLIKSFGQSGQGPGDFTRPQDLSILDGKYIVVGEYALNRRISLFDLNGNFMKLFVTKYYIFDSISLKNNKIAILTQKSMPSENKGTDITNYRVIIKDIMTEKDINVASFAQDAKRTNISLGPFLGKVFISKINDDKLLIGFSDTPEISIYSLDGQKLNSFEVSLERKRITDDMKKAYFRMLEEMARKRAQLKPWIQKMQKEDVFPDHIPYYNRIVVDSEDNILVYKNMWTEKVKIKKDPFELDEVKFQIYSKEGQHICNARMNFGNLKPFYPTYFFENYVYAQIKKKEDKNYNFMKLKLR